MKKVIFINSKGEKLTIYKSPYFLSRIEGTGATITHIQTHKSPNQDGESYVGNVLGYRQITIEGSIREVNKKRVMQLRQEMLSVLNPKLNLCKLIYKYDGDIKTIACIIDSSTTFPSSLRIVYQQFLIHLYCPDPLWCALEELNIDLVTWVPVLEFDEIEGFSTEQAPNYWIETAPEGEGFEEFESGFGIGLNIEFGYRLTKQIVEIDNAGDIDTPIRIVFRAHGAVEKPYIQDVETRKLLRVNRTLQAGYVLEITTKFCNKNVYLNGEKAHHYLDYLNSTWLQLKPGMNLIKYGAESGVEVLECRLYYTPRYLGV
ncbi:MAG: phage tail family protein [Clostridiales bacterium]|nr:phage tail family protein [Clostridiales bacterium]